MHGVPVGWCPPSGLLYFSRFTITSRVAVLAPSWLYYFYDDQMSGEAIWETSGSTWEQSRWVRVVKLLVKVQIDGEVADPTADASEYVVDSFRSKVVDYRYTAKGPDQPFVWLWWWNSL